MEEEHKMKMIAMHQQRLTVQLDQVSVHALYLVWKTCTVTENFKGQIENPFRSDNLIL